MASRFETFSEDEICVINEVVVQENTKKATNFGLSVHCMVEFATKS